MVRTTLWYGKPDDDWNLKNKRNISNTEKGSYNCGGYALGLFNWFCPWEEEDDGNIELGDDTDLEKMVNYMLQYLPLRLINSTKELKRSEYAVAFRVGNFDFHYMKRGANGVWYSKVGNLYYIDTFKEEVVLNKKESWYGRYDGKIVLMAMKKRG